MEYWLPYINLAILAATIVAIIIGPIMAVRVTRTHDDKKWRRDRRMTVLRDLMQTRGVRLDPLHVAALNVMELEFYGEASVLAAYKAYIRHLSSPLPMPDQQEPYFEQRFELFLNLIQELGRSLGLAFDRGDISKLAYSPVGWEHDQQMQRKNMALFAELLEGRSSVGHNLHVSTRTSDKEPISSSSRRRQLAHPCNALTSNSPSSRARIAATAATEAAAVVK